MAEPRGDRLSHLDESGAAHMVDVTGKDATKRTAVAAGLLRTRADVVELIATGGLPKGDALATARVAGILAALPSDVAQKLTVELATRYRAPATAVAASATPAAPQAAQPAAPMP